MFPRRNSVFLSLSRILSAVDRIFSGSSPSVDLAGDLGFLGVLPISIPLVEKPFGLLSLDSSGRSQVNENDAAVDGTCHPPGVKASKARGKKPQVEGKQLSDFQTMWSIKQDDLAMKENLSKMRIDERSFKAPNQML
ncbi:hypothetical protein F2Q70_00025114 [Brassica cretica]|uniref:No apical meristem-associated C-terminal domain-containing protein n=1 Tax=Brassica cretica TaxID=69181 RepID=A0A8S9LAE6_BRACR|nr:hypothetical protein F2Q70_00025114 [Brassica cretica]